MSQPCALLVAALLAGPLAARAADAPLLQPSRDVDVTYRVPVPGGVDVSLLQRLRWSAARRLQRVDLPSSGNWMVLDFTAHHMAMVRDDSREVLDLPGPQAADQPADGYVRAGSARVAGLDCTQWRTTDTRGEPTLACYTADGVLLRATEGPRVLMEAVSVTFAAQPAAIFQPPAGYTHRQGNRRDDGEERP